MPCSVSFKKMLFNKKFLSVYHEYYIQVHMILWTDPTIPTEKAVEDFGV